MSVFETLQANIIDPDTGRRNSLKQLLLATEDYNTISPCGDLREAKQRIAASEEPIDVIFLSRIFDADTVKAAMEEIHNTSAGECTVFVLLLLPETPTKTGAAESLALGAHGCLKAPYSVDDVREITNQAIAMREEMREERDRIGINGMVGEAIKFIDRIYHKYRLGQSPGMDKRNLDDIAKAITNIPDNRDEMYYNIMLDHFLKTKPPYFPPGISNYYGASRATQRRAERRRKEEEELRKQGKEPKQPKIKRGEPEILPNGRVAPPKLE
jgi:hypothetical protein